MFQLFIHENLIRIQPLVYKILQSDAAANANANGVHTKLKMSLPLVVGDIIMNMVFSLEASFQEV